MQLPDRFTVDDTCAFWRGLDVPRFQGHYT
jgi:hypothetical protein